MRISDWSSDVCSSDLANAGAGAGDMVMLSRVETRPAARVVFAPAQENLRLQGSANALKRSFFGRPLVAGDTVATAGQQRLPSGDMPPQLRQMLNAQIGRAHV